MTSIPIHEAKAQLRREMSARVAALDPEDREEWDRRMVTRAAGWIASRCLEGGCNSCKGCEGDTACSGKYIDPAPPAAGGKPVVLAYKALPDEPDIDLLLRGLLVRGFLLALPRVLDDGGLALLEVTDPTGDCRPGAFGIAEPRENLPRVDPAAVDVVLVPGRAFDTSGGRLGRGKGYYDRLLPTLSSAGRLALCYDSQIVDGVPREETDESVHLLITPSGIIDCSSVD